MTRSRYSLLWVISAVILLLISIGSSPKLTQNTSADISKATGLTITGNEDLLQQAKEKSWPGQGTKADPILIRNFEVDLSGRGANNFSVVQIKGTTKYLVIDGLKFVNDVVDPELAAEGIHIENATNIRIVNSDIRGFSYFGIRISYSSNISISTNKIDDPNQLEDDRNGSFAIDTISCNNVNIEENQISDVGYGISVRDTYKMNILNNEIRSDVYSVTLKNSTGLFANNQLFDAGIDYSQMKVGLEIQNNTVNSHPLVFEVDTGDLEFEGNYGQILLINAHSVSIQSIFIEKSTVALELINCTGVSVSDSIFRSNYFSGIRMTNTNSSQIINSIFEDNGYGIKIDGVNNNNFTKNEFRENEVGILFFDVTDYQMSSNYVADNIFIDNNEGYIHFYPDYIKSRIIDHNQIESNTVVEGEYTTTINGVDEITTTEAPLHYIPLGTITLGIIVFVKRKYN